MPIYEYACPSCGDNFEKLLLRSDEAVTCPACGAAEVNRRLSSFSVGRNAGTSMPMPACGEGSCCSSSCADGSCGLF